LFFLTS